MANGDVTGMDELLDMLADNPEEAKRQRAERLAAAKAKREEAYRLSLVNKLQVLASIQASLNSLDDKKEERRQVLRDQLAKAERAVEKYERLTGEAANGTEKEEFSHKLTSARHRKAEAEQSLQTLDAKFEESRAKQEANKNMNTGLLRQAAREGRLPFDPALIDRPGDAVVSTTGELFAVDDMLEMEKDGNIWKILAVDAGKRLLRLRAVIGYEEETLIEVGKLGKHVKVFYSESELALKKLLAKTSMYTDLRSSGIDKDVFLAHRGEIAISPYRGAVYVHEGNYLATFGPYESAPEGTVAAWPEPENEDFRKAVCTQYLERKKAKGYVPDGLMVALFGPDFAAVAEGYGSRGTDAEILALVSDAWTSLQELHELRSARDEARHIRALGVNALSEHLIREARKRYDNTSDMYRIAGDFITGILQEAEVRAREEEAEEKRRAEETLKANPDYKEVPAALTDQFRELGITVRSNTMETTLPGYRGRRGTTYAPFARWFLQDTKAKMGRLYRMKDIIKNRYGASFTADWKEHSGAWWHVPSSVDLEELYELLA